MDNDSTIVKHFIWAIVVSCILFSGDPDLIDAIIHWIMRG